MMPRVAISLFAAGLLLVLPVSQAAEKIGLVLMHGKLGTPSAFSLRALETHLASNGILVEIPEMPWSKERQYEPGYEQAMNEIEAAAKRLRAQGATRVVIGGHSMGAAAALTYGARKPADGLVLLALGHSPQTATLQKRFDESVARARGLVAAGKGEEKESFDDFDASKRPPVFTVTTTARNYLSYFDPDGIANTLKSAEALPTGIPVLWVDGTNENPGLKSYGQKIYAAMTTQAKKYIEVDAGHLDTPTMAKEEVLAWLRGLK